MRVLEERLYELRKRIDEIRPEARFIVVTKGQPVSLVEQLYTLGVREIAENRVVEAIEKMQHFPFDMRCHFIGILQRNKVAKAVQHFCMIQSVGSIALAEAISAAAQKSNMVIPILLQVNFQKKTKYGFSFEEVYAATERILQLPNISLNGLMTIAPKVDHDEKGAIRETFKGMQNLFHELKESLCREIPHFCELSMGMSRDFELALEYGATIIRIGSYLFSHLS